MRLLVYMRDGRTVYALRRRGELSQLVGAEPWGEHEGATVVRGTWNPNTGRFIWQPNVHLRHLARGSISHVEAGDPNQAADVMAA